MCVIDWKIVLEFAKAALSWPPVLAALLFWFVRRYSPEIGKLIARITELKAPGVSLTISAQEKQQSQPPLQELVTPEDRTTSASNAAAIEAKTSVAITGATETSTQTIDAQYMALATTMFPAIDPMPFAKWMSENPGPAFAEYIDKMLQLKAERAYNLIFGTQISALELMATLPPQASVPSAHLVPQFERHIALSGSGDRKFADFVTFLANNAFIENTGPVDGPLYRITPLGRFFLNHIKQYYPLMWNTKAY